MSAIPASSLKNKKSPLIKQSFPVLEMTCAACAVSVESMLKSTPGVKDASVNYANQTAAVEYDTSVAQTSDLQNAVRSIGYDLVIDTEDPQAIKEEAQRKQYEEVKSRTLWSSLLALPVFLIGMFFMDMPYGTYISMVLTAPVVFYFGRNFFVHAWKQARFRKANMDTLVALSTGIAFLFSLFNTFFPEFWHSRGIHAHVYYEAAAVVIAFISLGKLIEERAKANTGSAIKKLMGLQPKTVRAIVEGQEVEIPIASVNVGHILLVRPGEKIPVDGSVIEGVSFVDESMISGEPVAVEKKTNEKVFAGTINQKGSLKIEAQKVGGNTILAQIIKMVQEAQGSKAPVQQLVDKIAGIFVPIVIAISILTFATWMIVGGDNAFTHALLTSVTVLVIACPCALGLATPTAIMVGVGKGAENNILIKDAESLELAHTVNAIILDKTGTITEGKPVVTNSVWTAGEATDKNTSILYALEVQSEHPLAQAIVDHLKAEKVRAIPLKRFESITGKGVQAQVEDKYYYLGNQKLMEEAGVEMNSELITQVGTWQAEAKTVVYFASSSSALSLSETPLSSGRADEGKVLALIAIADKVKETSRSAIQTLQDRGIEVYMLTGDNPQTAKAVASQVGLNHYKAEVLPSEKADFIKQLQQEGKIVAMVGDGINDSHALAQADVSIAMGKGSDIAMDVAKMTLITSDLNSIPKALNLSTKTVRGIRQNLFWAFIYNIIGIPLAAGVLYPFNGFLLDPMIAGAAMALSSVSVVSNSLRLKFAKI